MQDKKNKENENQRIGLKSPREFLIVVDIRNAISKIELAEKGVEQSERDLRIRKASAMVCKLKLINIKCAGILSEAVYKLSWKVSWSANYSR
ncbi:hypothetical protein RIR_jg40131.t1 [Rhizophagus irregularis DAOM 181602=DAOM 197198]|nr:hypothetical protein RIR_jg40131.t1 [Rhizophagus irregularis DAOM 181602=DAOM 197198]